MLCGWEWAGASGEQVLQSRRGEKVARATLEVVDVDGKVQAPVTT